jgi:hypothetical protein
MGINDPAPALGRGLRILQLLDGHAWRLEELVRATALPRSSLARILDSLEANGCVLRTGVNWQAVTRLVMAAAHPGIERWRASADRVAQAGWRGELWSFQPSGPVLVSVAEPSDLPAGLVAAGWGADREEWMAPVQLWWARRGGQPRRAWYRDGTVVQTVPAACIRRDLVRLRQGGCAQCPAANHRGLVRAAIALPQHDGCLAAAGTAAAPPRLLAEALAMAR